MTITLSNIILLLAAAAFCLIVESWAGKLMRSRYFPSRKTLRVVVFVITFIVFVILINALSLNPKY